MPRRPTPRIGHWSLLARARAVEDQAFVVALNGCGDQGGITLGGRSAVIDPWGAVLAEAGDDEQVLTVELDLAQVTKVRADFPVLADRRVGSPAVPTAQASGTSSRPTNR